MDITPKKIALAHPGILDGKPAGDFPASQEHFQTSKQENEFLTTERRHPARPGK
jgi:hypothetical protein